MSFNLYLAITEKCNLDCKYCNVYHSEANMSFDLMKKAFFYAIKYSKWNKINIYFVWWEPLLYFDLIKKFVLWINFINDRFLIKTSFFITTNWTLLNNDILNFCKKNSIFLSISIDSLSYEYNLRNFKNSTYVSITNIIQKKELINKFKDILRAKLVIVPSEVPNMLNNIESIFNFWFIFIDFQPAHWIFRSKKNTSNFLLNTKKIKDFFLDKSIKSSLIFWDDSIKDCNLVCPKWENEICIDSFWNVLVCNAFLAYSNLDRNKFAFDNIINSNFNDNLLLKLKNWMFCKNNNIICKWQDLVNCKECIKNKSCYRICEAIPNKWKKISIKVVKSNYIIFRDLYVLFK